MTTEGEAPKRPEIEQQLRRILGSETFSTHLKLRELLERLVKDTLDGKAGGPLYEKTLATEVFGHHPRRWDRRKSVVRTQKGNLRERLEVYYNAEGSSDAVGIRFPERTGPAAQFHYRRTNHPEPSVERLAIGFSRRFAARLGDAGFRMAELEVVDPDAPPYGPRDAVLAETMLECAMQDETWRSGIPAALIRAEGLVNTAMALDNEHWRAHVVAGAIHCCRFAWDQADAAFERALHLSPEDTRAHLWYAAFLLAVGRSDEGKAAIACRGKKPRSLLSPYVIPLFRYVLREVNDAEDERAYAATLFGDVGGYQVGEEWPGQILASRLLPALRHLGSTRAPHAETALQNPTEVTFNSLAVFIYLSVGNNYQHFVEGGKYKLPPIEDGLRWQYPVLLALAYMGLGIPAEAIAQLEKACDMGHPLMVWLHLWPIFDPLRDDARFKALIKRMNLPHRSLPPTRA